jgi:hypothetical protein
MTGGAAVVDPQGALMLLPSFQVGLLIAIWVAAFARSGWPRFACAVVLLLAAQAAVGGGLRWLAFYGGVTPLVRDVRAWALLGPLVVTAIVLHVPPRRD